MDAGRYAALDDNKCVYRHVVMWPVPYVLHIHFGKQEEAAHVLARIDALTHGEPVDSTSIAELVIRQRKQGSSLYSDGLLGVCWNGRSIVKNAFPRMEPFLSFEEVVLKRELAGMPEHFSLITTWDDYGCSASLFQHEMAHAVWSKFPSYRERATRLVSSMPNWLKKAALGALLKWGYVQDNVPYVRQKQRLLNEMQAQIYGGADFPAAECGDSRKAVDPFRDELWSMMSEYCPGLNSARNSWVHRWRTLTDDNQDVDYGMECWSLPV